MDDPDLSQRVALGYALARLRLAVAALGGVTPGHVTLQEMGQLKDRLSEVEVSTAALLQKGGVTWEAMAREVNMRRQSLNRRLGKQLPAYMGNLAPRQKQVRELQSMLRNITELAEELLEAGGKEIAGRVQTAITQADMADLAEDESSYESGERDYRRHARFIREDH